MGAPKKKDVLALEPRRDIYNLIRRSPGVHLRGIERELGLPFGQVLYHLDYLERSDVLVVKKDGGFKRYFVKSMIGRHEKAMISTFRHELPRKIAILLLISPNLTHRAILSHFDVSGSTLSFHLNKMVENGILERRESGNENYYRIIDERTAAKILVLHRESFLDEAVDRFAEMWLTVNYLGADERFERAREGAESPQRVAAGASTQEELASNVLNGVPRAAP